MGVHASDLAVRRHERYLCDLAARIAVEGPEVRLARAALGAHGQVAARLVDVSRGGMSLSTGVYLPPSCLIAITVNLPGGAERTLLTRARVHRSAMTDRTPTYYIGAAYEGEDAARDAAVEQLIGALREAGAKPVPEPRRA